MSGALPCEAVVGVGRLSRLMVARLRGAGHSVTVTTRTRERALNVAAETGAQAVNSPREAAASAGIVIVSLSDGRTVRKVYEGSDCLLDTPVPGSVEPATHGELTVLAGGSEEALDRVRPVIGVLATRFLHFGDSDKGSGMKPTVNSLLLSMATGLSESLVLPNAAASPGRTPTTTGPTSGEQDGSVPAEFLWSSAVTPAGREGTRASHEENGPSSSPS